RRCKPNNRTLFALRQSTRRSMQKQRLADGQFGGSLLSAPQAGLQINEREPPRELQPAHTNGKYKQCRAQKQEQGCCGEQQWRVAIGGKESGVRHTAVPSKSRRAAHHLSHRR